MADSIIGAQGVTTKHVEAATHQIAAIAQSAEIVLLQACESTSVDEAKNLITAGTHLVQQIGFLADLLSDKTCGMVTVGDEGAWLLPAAWEEGEATLQRQRT